MFGIFSLSQTGMSKVSVIYYYVSLSLYLSYKATMVPCLVRQCDHGALFGQTV